MSRPHRILALWALAAIAACQSTNHPPSLVLVPDQYVLVGQRLELPLVGADPDGDSLQFFVDGLPPSATVAAQSPISATLIWSPSITDTEPGGTVVRATIRVRDGRGGEASQPLAISVFPIFGTPVVELPAGIALNMAREETLELAVRVKDDDSTAVTLSLIEAPEAAVLSRSGPKSAVLFWRPTPLEREQTVHRIIIGADDGDNPPVSHTLLVVLLNAEPAAGCAGSPPAVAHTPPGDTFLEAGPLTFAASVTDSESTVASVEVGFSLGDPEAGLEAVVLERDADDGPLFVGATSLSALPPTGVLLRYRLLAQDNDDPVGVACDQKTRAPKSGWYAVAVYPPGAAPTACLEDGAEPDDDDAEARALSPGVYPDRRLCPGDPDTARITLAAGERLTAVLTRHPAHGTPTLTLRDDAGTIIDQATGDAPALRVDDPSGAAGPRVLTVTPGPGDGGLTYALDLTTTTVPCADDPLEPNATPATAVPLSPGLLDSGVLCPGDQDWYRFSLGAGEQLEAHLDHDPKLGDLDLELRDPATGALLKDAATLASLETLRYTAPSARTVALGVVGYQGAGNAYRLETDVGAAASACDEDILGPHPDAASAATLMSDLYENLATCADAPDWFAVELNGGETLTVLAQSEEVAVELAIFTDPAAAPVATGLAAPHDVGETSHVAAGPGRLYYRVQSAAPARYTLLQDIADPAGSCQPDRFEPNDTAETARPLAPGVQTQLRLCSAADTDAFRVTLAAFDVLTVLTQHAFGGYTDLTILGPDGATLDETLDPGKGAQSTVVAPAAGEYTVLIAPFEAQGLVYDLSVLRQ